MAHEHGGLYKFQSQIRSRHDKRSFLRLGRHLDSNYVHISDEVTANKACANLSLETLHARLGHTSLSKMRHILACKNVLTNKFFCETCILAKAHRLPFGRSSISTKIPFELVHMDLWGSYRVANINGARYFLTIVDDFTRNTWTQLLHNKTQVYAAIERFLNMVETQFKTKVTMIRSDNGTEFIQTACLNLFAARGILHQRYMVRTPQQNGVLERKHRHLFDTARALRLFAGFPKNILGRMYTSRYTHY